MPAAVHLITYVLPARYYVSLLQTIFLAGDIWAVILPDVAVLAIMAAALLFLMRRTTQKKLD
jgi:ABC-2 type transport system permease protein